MKFVKYRNALKSCPENWWNYRQIAQARPCTWNTRNNIEHYSSENGRKAAAAAAAAATAANGKQ